VVRYAVRLSQDTKELPMGRPVVLGIGTLIILLLAVAYFF
jgi:hypothetical protein